MHLIANDFDLSRAQLCETTCHAKGLFEIEQLRDFLVTGVAVLWRQSSRLTWSRCDQRGSQEPKVMFLGEDYRRPT